MAYEGRVLAWNGPVTKAPTLSGTGAQADNLFTVTGSCELIVWGELTTGGTFNLTGLYLEVDDGTAQVDITADGSALSNLAAGTMVYRSGLAASAIAVSDNAAGDVIDCADAGKDQVHVPFIVTKKTGVATHVRTNYDTTDNPCSGQITWTCYWRALSSDGAVVAAS